MGIRPLRISALALALALAAVPIAWPARPSREPAVTPPAATSSPGGAALRVTLDPETGRMAEGVVPRAQAGDRNLQEQLSRSTDGLVEIHHPEGHVSVHLRGRFHSASVVRRDADGTLRTACVDDHALADRFRRRCAHPGIEVQ